MLQAVTLAFIGLVLLLAPTNGFTISGTTTKGASLFERDAHIFDLSSSDAMSALHRESLECPWLLVYYDSSCGHCRTMAPRLAKFSWRAGTEASLGLQSVLVGGINCAVYDQECRRHNISDVPTILFVAPGSSVWQPLSGVEDSETAIHALQKVASVTLKSMNTVRTESCRSLREFYVKEKTRLIADQLRNDTTHHADPAFSEVRAFHQEDVAGALFYTMRHEVPMVPLRGQNLQSLTSFLNLVATTLPGLRADVLHAELVARPAGTSFSATEWKALVERVGIPYPKQGGGLDGRGDSGDEIAWNTCKGSGWQYRGFTCGLWLLYHALTVNAADGSSGKALLIIRQYVTRFFGCEDCRRHFSEFHFDEDKSGVQQLWRAHNQVNERLRKVVDGMDPKVPKRAFPDLDVCTDCGQKQDEEKVGFDETKVVEFLRRWYAWNASFFPPPALNTQQGSDGGVEATCGIDTCHIPQPDATPKGGDHADEDLGIAHHSVSPLSRRTRSPLYVLRRDPLVLNVVLTSVVVVLCVYAGKRFANRELSPFGTARQRRRLQL